MATGQDLVQHQLLPFLVHIEQARECIVNLCGHGLDSIVLDICIMTTPLIWIIACCVEITPSRRHVVKGLDHLACSDG